MSWQTFSLRDVVESTQSGFASGEKNVTDGFKHLRMNNIHADGRLDLSLVRTVPQELATAKYRLRQDDVLVCTTNSGKLVGKSAMFGMGGDFAFSNHLTRLRVQRDIAEPAFVQKQLWFKWLHGEIEPLCKHWVNQSTLPKEELLGLEVSLPDVDKQRRIVAKLDQITAHIDEAKARLDTIPTTLKRFRQSILAAACSGRLTADWRISNLQATGGIADKEVGDNLPDLPSSWCYERLGNLLQGLKYGTSQKCDYEKKGKPVFRIPNIGDGVLLNDNMKYAELPEKEYQQLALQAGDILLIRSNGSVSLVGKTALVSSEFAGYAYAGYLIRLRPNEKVRSDYLNHVLASMWLRQQIEIPARSTSGVNNINSEEVRNLLIPLPSVDEQTEIVRRVEALFKQADAIEARYKTARVFVEKLTPSVLAKAFRGELG